MNDKTRSTGHPGGHDLDSLREVAALALDTAGRTGASASEVALGRTAGLDVNVRRGEV